MQTLRSKFPLWAEAPPVQPAGPVLLEVYVSNPGAALAVFAARLAGVTFRGASGIVLLQVDATPECAAVRIELGPGQTRAFLQDVSFAFHELRRLEDAAGCDLAYWQAGALLRTNVVALLHPE
jgi:hypothetical protein